MVCSALADIFNDGLKHGLTNLEGYSVTDVEKKERIEAIEAKIEQKKKELESVEGTPTEIYTRIVGYYRSLKNWNKGKREEYDHRQVFDPALVKKTVGTLHKDETSKETLHKRTSFIPEKATFKGVADFGEVAV